MGPSNRRGGLRREGFCEGIIGPEVPYRGEVGGHNRSRHVVEEAEVFEKICGFRELDVGVELAHGVYAGQTQVYGGRVFGALEREARCQCHFRA